MLPFVIDSNAAGAEAVFMHMIDPLYSLSGFAVGLLVGMTGVGGGSLMTPLLILLFGIHPATAVGTDLLYAAATKTGGTLVHGFARSIDWRVVRRLAAGSIPATIITLAAWSYFRISADASRSLITLVLSIALFLTAFVLVFGRSIVALYRARMAEIDPQRTAASTAAKATDSSASCVVRTRTPQSGA